MKKIISLAVAMAFAGACGVASAGTVTFETFGPGIYSNGDLLVDGQQTLTVRGQGGFDGATLDGSDPTACFIGVCPVGNSSIYYAGLNDGAVSFGLSGSLFNLTSVDFGFILPAPAEVFGPVGQLIVTGNDGTSVSQDFGLQNGNGDFAFARFDFAGAFAMGRFTEATFSACLYTGNGNECVNPAGNQAQFAIDNITFVPEPGSLPLVALSLVGMLAASRRRKSA
ncbi:MAG: NF038120 family PEP-CTERM protein [Pseudomonadota bacterium]